MIFLSDIQGTITAIVPDKIYQGSSNAKELILIAPFPSTSAVSVAIRLPNGQLLTPYMLDSYTMTLLPDFNPALFDSEGHAYSAWRMSLNAPVTAYGGDISVQFIIATNGSAQGIIETTSESTVNIGRGTPYLMPESPSGWADVLRAIQTYYEDIREAIEWDYVITDKEYGSAPGTAFHEKIRNLLANASGRVLLKNLYSTEIGVINVPATVTYLKLINCSFGGELLGHVGCTVEGAVGAYANGAYNVLLLNVFGDVMYCRIVSCLNCGRVENSHLYLCHSNENHTLPYVTISDCLFEDFNNDDNITAVLIQNYAARITNIGFIKGEETYREIRGASTVSGVWRSGNTPITYEHCRFVDGLSCMDYYSVEDDGQAIIAKNDGSKGLLPVYSKEQSDERYVSSETYNEDITALQEDVQANSDAIDTANANISKNANNIATNTAAIEDVRNSVTRVYKYVGSVASFNLLPASANIGDVYNVESEYTDPVSGVVYPAGTNFAWDGSRWDPLGGDFGEYSERLATAESDISDLKDDVEALDADLDTAKADITVLEEKEEWDFVITKLEDFTTAKLATMSGRVLVKGVEYLIDENDPISSPPLDIYIPASVSLIEFVDSKIYASIFARGETRISGFVGDYLEDGWMFLFSSLSGFEGVEFCSGRINLSACRNVSHCKIHSAGSCTNLSDIEIEASWIDGNLTVFYSCRLIDNVRFNTDLFENDEAGIIVYEFASCAHISNVINDNPEGMAMTYENCTFVDGDTCDGYYTEEDNGKVQTVNTSGSKSLISVYDKTEIDTMYGDIETALDSIIAIQNALIGGTT